VRHNFTPIALFWRDDDRNQSVAQASDSRSWS